MADTFTPNYNLVMPGIGGDVNTWGTLLNSNFSIIDTGMAANLDLAGTRLMTGSLKLAFANPLVQYRDTAQTLPAGLWRTLMNSTGYQVQRNTANAGDFSTATTPFYIDLTDGAHFVSSVAAASLSTTGNAGIGGSASIGTTATVGTALTAGSAGLASEAHLGLQNNAFVGYFYVNTSGVVGLYDQGSNLVRWSTDYSGNFQATGNVTAYSDERLKCDWRALPDNFIEKLVQVKAGTYMRKDTGERHAGSSAQDWLELLPEVVVTNADNGFHSLAYGNAALVAVIELARMVLSLKAEINSMRGDAK